MRTRLRTFILTLITLGALGLVRARQSAPQTRGNEKSCRGLHAGIRVEFVRRYEPFTQPSYVMISFVLLNDDDKPLDTSEASWRLIIDGREVGDSGIVFGNGLGPIGGWKTLNPGATAEFRKGFGADKYDLNRRTGPDAKRIPKHIPLLRLATRSLSSGRKL